MTIEDNCSIEKSIIACNVVIREKCIIEQGCIISNNVLLDAKVHLKSYSYLINDSDTNSSEEAVGKEGLGNYFESEQDSDNEEGEIDIWGNANREADADASSVSTSFSDSSDDESDSPVYDEYKCKCIPTYHLAIIFT